MESLNNKLDDYQEQSSELDDRYEMLLQKYQMQFSSLQSILSSTEQTRSFLTQRFGGDSN
jgi:flagellar hook-associated protein 2